MNILFFSFYENCPNIGGIERVTDILAKEFSNNHGLKCYNIYEVSVDEDLPRTQFEKSFYIPQADAKRYAEIITKYQIDVIINQERHQHCKTLHQGILLSGQKCMNIYCCHNTPLMPSKSSIKFSRFLSEFKSERNVRSALKLIAFPFYRQYILNMVRRYLSDAYNLSDKNVLLSNEFKKLWLKEARIPASTEELQCKITAIGNPLTFDCFANDSDIEQKEKRVVIVCRLNNSQKRIDLALKIWRLIENDHQFDDWCLDIVGDGKDRQSLEQFATKHLSRVKFHGRQDPIRFYKRSAIFMMTSKHEGWGMTLAEASQLGCVPVVFDSFPSVHDIVVDSVNGFLIRKNDIKAFVKKLKILMLDRTTREKIATNAVRMSKRFTISEVYNKWNSLFAELLTDYTKK